jgi:hypothetical protein
MPFYSIDQTFRQNAVNTFAPADTVNVTSVDKIFKINTGGFLATYSGSYFATGTVFNGALILNNNGTLNTAMMNSIFAANRSRFAANFITAFLHQSDGKFLFGFSWGGMLRLNSNGTFDAAFFDNIGTAGNGKIEHITVDYFNNIYVSGQFSSFNGFNRMGMVKLSPGGVIDSSFLPIISPPFIDKALVLPDQYTIICGKFARVSGRPRKYIAKLDPYGNSIPFWGHNTTRPNEIVKDFFVDSTTNPSVVTVIGDFTKVGTLNRKRIFQINYQTGTVNTGYSPSFDGPANIALKESNGKTLILGDFNTVDDAFWYRKLVQLNSDSSVYTGLTYIDIDGEITCACFDSTGSLIIGGSFTTINGSTTSKLARLTLVP